MKVLNGLDLASQRITNLASPSADTDGTNKAYVDQKIYGLAWKTPARVATTANGALATAYAAGQTIDGVTLVTGDRVLLKDQTTGTENGLYTVNATGAPTRAVDMDTSSEAVNNSTVTVSEGTVNADTAWTLTNNGTITLGTTALTWAKLPGAGSSYTAGNGVDITSQVISAKVKASGGILVDSTGLSGDTSVLVRKYATAIGNGAATSIAVTHGLGTRDITWSIYNASTYEAVWTDAVVTDANTLTLTFASAPATSAYRVVVHG